MFTNTTIFTKEKLLNILILLVPLSLIFGNPMVNLNVVLICLIGFLIYGFSIFKIKRDIVACLLCAFFLYLIFITLVTNIPNYPVIITPTGNLNNSIYYKEHIIKSFSFLRFLIFFLVINKFATNKEFNFKFFFILIGGLSFLVAIDVYLIFFLDKKFIDQSLIADFTGFFSDEKIAGGYLQKFSLFFIFSLMLFLPIARNIKLILISLFFLFFFYSIILTNNRMPMLIYLSSFVLWASIEKKLRKYLILILFISSISLFYFLNLAVKGEGAKKIDSFIGATIRIVTMAPKLFYHGKLNIVGQVNTQGLDFGSGHLVTFNSGVQLWKQSKIFGGGLKSFRLNCIQDHKFQVCTSHPHNYLIEILVDVGLVGFVLIYLAFTIVVIRFLKRYLKDFNLYSRNLVIPFFLIFFFEIFPFRSTGSFFTTSNAVVIFLVIAIINNYYKNNNFIK
jgi:O-antigen ligase